MSNNKKERRLLLVYNLYILIPGIIVTIIILSTIGLMISYRFTHDIVHFVLLIVIASLGLAGYIAFYIFASKRLHVNYYDKLFKVTYENIQRISKNNVDLQGYGHSSIKEINMLDAATKEIKERLATSYLIVKEADYSNLSLDYVDESKNLITIDSFGKNLRNIIFLSQSYRNAIIEVYFRLAKSLSEKQKSQILDLYRKAFAEKKDALFMFGAEDKSLLIYLPVIDSFSQIKEKLDFVATNSSVLIRDEKGVRNIPAQFAVVAYPYSDEDMLLGDLKYAKRMNKPYYLFLPNRLLGDNSQQLLKNSSMNLNYANRVISSLAFLDYSSTDNDKNMKILQDSFNILADYLHADESGVIAYDDIEDKYYSYVRSDKSKLFAKGNISSDFINALESTIDDDQSYYFSTRSHAGFAIEREIDLRGITSGIYYIVKSIEDGRIKAVIYFFNKGKDMLLDTYLRETFFVLALRIESYFEKKEIFDHSNMKDDEFENVLALNDMFFYRVDKEFHISRVSKNMLKIFPKAKVGELCYKAFFDADKQCRGCPLITFKKKYFEYKGKRYETSTNLKDRKAISRPLCIREADNAYEHTSLFQDNLLVYSYKSFIETIRNEYISQGRGYVVLLSIDNYEKFISELGSEAYEYVVRNYVRNIKNKLKTEEVYYYNPTTLALHLPYSGHADVINDIESIYQLSKEMPLENNKVGNLNITYLPVGYPRGYAEVEDYLKHLSDFYHSDSYEKNKDFVYFADFKITRSASKHDFMVSVLESEFSSFSSTSMNLQPIVRVKDRHIFGAEILLRINDVHRNIFFNANEISRIAEQENKTHLITGSTINYIGNLYKEYGNSVFKINKFNRIAINIDKTYLKDNTLIKEMVKLSRDNKLPKGFISLEIPEDMIPNNIEGIKRLSRELSNYNILFSCDRYLGEYVNVEQLKELGFSEIKIARDLIMKIDTDPVKYQDLLKLVAKAKQVKMNVAAVGVESEQQFKLLRDADENMAVQGYYLYKPLTRSDFISALIAYGE